MDPTTLAAAVANALILAVTTDAWEKARSSIVALWRRVHPDRAETIGAELAEVRQDVIAARENNDTESETGLAADWQRRLIRLLQADPEIADEMQGVLDEVLTPSLEPADRERVNQIVMNAHARDHAQVYQAGRDMHISDRGE